MCDIMRIIEIDPLTCKRWKYADRGNFELGKISDLANDIKLNGQKEPVHVRKLTNDPKYKYEVIAGSRRWMACRDNEMLLQAIIDDVSDENALLIQSRENDKAPISEYSRGMILSKAKKELGCTQHQLAKINNISVSKVKKLLCFTKVDKEIWDAVNDMKSVSSNTAEIISQLSKKSPAHKNALIDIAEDIKKGFGEKRIKKLIDDRIVGKDKKQSENELIQSKSGQIFAEWKSNKLQIANDVDFDRDKFNKHMLAFFEKN